MKKKNVELKNWLQPKLRRLSYQWPPAAEAMKLARVERGKYRCAICNNIFGPKEVQRDHVNPIIPVEIPFEHLSLHVYLNNLFCGVEGYQILCLQDHIEKSNKEDALRKEWIEKEKYIVYKTTNNINKKSYIGIHKCIDYDDNYLGSGIRLKLAFKKYGRSNFSREVLYCYSTLEEALAKEKEIVNEEFLTNEDIYNLAIGGRGINPSKKYINAKKVVCHQTGEVFNSIMDVSKSLNIDHAEISRAINNPNHPVQNLHFFTTDTYDSSINVTFPRNENLRRLVHLNTKTIYGSMKECCEKLELPYKSVRNALSIRHESGFFKYKEHYFLNEEEYDSTTPTILCTKRILCVELNKEFESCSEAARYLKHENPNHGGIAIGKAIRENRKMYGYTWKLIVKSIEL